MNINPYSQTLPHYDSYEDFYKFFEVRPEKIRENTPIEVFPPVEADKFLGEQIEKMKEKKEQAQRKLFS